LSGGGLYHAATRLGVHQGADNEKTDENKANKRDKDVHRDDGFWGNKKLCNLLN
jgi:hypothetical protein